MTEQELFDKYPNIFRDRTKPMTQTCMCWGIECGPGWYPLIDKLCGSLDLLEKTFGIQTVADQVKEKFGSLSFYYHTKAKDGLEINEKDHDTVRNIISSVIDDTCQRSAYTCESCGSNFGSIKADHGWYSCRCPECRKKKEQERSVKNDAN